MHLANLPELRIMIGLAWEIAPNGLAETRPAGGCAADMPRAMHVFVGEGR
jgi:hypothetical protein